MDSIASWNKIGIQKISLLQTKAYKLYDIMMVTSGFHYSATLFLHLYFFFETTMLCVLGRACVCKRVMWVAMGILYKYTYYVVRCLKAESGHNGIKSTFLNIVKSKLNTKFSSTVTEQTTNQIL